MLVANLSCGLRKRWGYFCFCVFFNHSPSDVGFSKKQKSVCPQTHAVLHLFLCRNHPQQICFFSIFLECRQPKSIFHIFEPSPSVGVTAYLFISFFYTNSPIFFFFLYNPQVLQCYFGENPLWLLHVLIWIYYKKKENLGKDLDVLEILISTRSDVSIVDR